MCLACENRACGVLTIQTFGSLNFLFQYGTATKFSRYIDNLFGFTTLLTESKYYISVLRYVSSNDIVYFSPHALFLQARMFVRINHQWDKHQKLSPDSPILYHFMKYNVLRKVYFITSIHRYYAAGTFRLD